MGAAVSLRATESRSEVEGVVSRVVAAADDVSEIKV
jgi:hypothetical protein